MQYATSCKQFIEPIPSGPIARIGLPTDMYSGTFVDNEILGDKEKRVIYDNTLFTIGATSIILHSAEHSDE